MEHYFTKNPEVESNEKIAEYDLNETQFKFITDNGVFSRGRVDFATDFLLRVLCKESMTGDILDVGCGFGVIGIVLSKIFDVKATMIDVNERALELTKKNVKLNKVDNAKVVESNSFENIKDMYDIIITNPPIHAGKEVIYNIYEGAKEHLIENGSLYIVINKKHGALSTIKHLNELFGNCEILDKKAGFNVIRCVKRKGH